MYAIYAYIDPPNHPNVGIYGIHGVFGFMFRKLSEPVWILKPFWFGCIPNLSTSQVGRAAFFCAPAEDAVWQGRQGTGPPGAEGEVFGGLPSSRDANRRI